MDIQSIYNNIKLVLFDVDGVLTDGKIHITAEGEMVKPFNVKDGLAIELLRGHKILTGVVSGKTSPALDFRCEQLGFDFVITGCKNKLPRVNAICEKINISLKELAFCGDDVLDLPVMQLCGLGCAPKDAHALVCSHADLILSTKGGNGVARELADKILLARHPDLDSVYKILLDKIRDGDTGTLEQ
jgi:3-deoxy-D-manno-octulosonate 8-phosphate phosphatase (KDO 8-P phosphatase)